MLFQVKRCNISKEFYTRTCKFSSEKYSCYVGDGWPAKKDRMQQKYESRLPSFLSPFCWNLVLSKKGTALVSSSICKMVAVLHSRGFSPGDPATKVQKQSNPPIPGLKSTNKVDKSRAMPAYVPGVVPGMAADKCITSLSGLYNDMYSNYK